MNYLPSFNSRFILRSKIFSRAVAVLVMLISALVLAGWLFDIHRLKSVYDQITMKANAALALFLMGASLLALNFDDKYRLARRAGQLFAAMAATAGALTLGEHIFGWNLGIDELVFTEPLGALATTSPGRMGPPASTCITLSGIALLLLHAGRAIPFAQALSIITGLWALLAIIGYAYDAEQLYSVAGYTGIALHTAVSLFVSSLGLLAARIDSGITSVISSDGAGGQMARRLLIAAVGVPFLLGWLRLNAQWRGYYDHSDGTAYLILAIIIIFTAIIWQSAAKLNYTEQQRLAAEDRFRLVVEASPAAKVMVDEEGRIILVNSQTERLFGYSREELIGQPVEMLVPDRFHSLHAQHRAGFIRMPQARSMGAGRDLFGRRKDGSEVPIEIGLNPIKVKEQTLILGSIVDITERKRGEEERARLLRSEQEARAEADAANHAKDEFLATVSHELRTPLNAILGWARILSAGRIDAQTSRQAIETIERSARTQAQLIEDLLDMSRVVSGKLRLNLEPVNLARVAEAALETVRLAAQAKMIQLEAKLDSPCSTVTGDATRLQQIVWNLLSNAIKFTPRGGRIEIRLESNDAEAQITVSDTGQGISPEILPYIFERFRQADSKDTRQHGGLGLGLAIVRHLVELHGGTVTAESAGHGQGAVFVVRLPLATGQTEALKMGESEVDYDRALVEPLPELAGLKVLVVDDEESAREVVRLILSRSGAEVTTAASAAEALAVIAQRRPDVVVSDIGMPGENGYELISRLRRLPVEEGGTIPAIALTAYAKTEDRMHALSSGYQTHVSKPVEPAELVLVIASIVAHTKRGQ